MPAEPAQPIAEHRHVVSKNGNPIMGQITVEQAAALGCKAGQIRLLFGFEAKGGAGFGLCHIQAHATRMAELKGLNLDAIDAVILVAGNFTAADLGADGRIIAVLDHAHKWFHLVLEWDEEGFWSVTTLIPKRHRRDVKDTWVKVAV